MPRTNQKPSPDADTDNVYTEGTYTEGAYTNTTSKERQTADGARVTYDSRLAPYYAALELPYGADLNAVKQAHRRLIKQYHPDRFYDDASKQHTAGEVTRRLNEAYQELCDYLEVT
ncbi:MAG: J domain-containing protein [Deinococcota bacterium]